VGAESGLGAKLDRILAAIERGQVLMIDGDALVGATANKMDNKLGQRRVLAARGAV
jgi:Na+-transporting NADH:ubiquinone oxidoreductase subunit NqrA